MSYHVYIGHSIRACICSCYIIKIYYWLLIMWVFHLKEILEPLELSLFITLARKTRLEGDVHLLKCAKKWLGTGMIGTTGYHLNERLGGATLSRKNCGILGILFTLVLPGSLIEIKVGFKIAAELQKTREDTHFRIRWPKFFCSLSFVAHARVMHDKQNNG